MSTKEAPVAAWRRWLETLLIAALGVVAFGVYRANAPSDSELSAGWLVLLPVLSGAQHGTLYGFLSAGMLCGIGLQALALQASPLRELGIAVAHGWGLVFAGVGGIAGYFRDLEERRYAQLSQRARVCDEELQTLERAFACLQWSHAQLEQQFCTQPHSLASILDAAAGRMQELRSSAALAELMLEVIVSRTRVQAASLYALGPYNQLPAAAIASLGVRAPQAEVAGHPLVQRALHSSGLVSIVDAPARAQAPNGVVAAVALQSSCAQLRMLFVVHQLPFEAFCVEELRNLHVLLARLIDLAQQRIDALDETEASMPLATTSWSASAGGTYSSVARRRASARRAQLR